MTSTGKPLSMKDVGVLPIGKYELVQLPTGMTFTLLFTGHPPLLFIGNPLCLQGIPFAIYIESPLLFTGNRLCYLQGIPFFIGNPICYLD